MKARGHVPPEEAGHERVRRLLPHRGRCADLFDATGVHDHEPVGQRERLVVVVGHEQGGEPEPYEERAQLGDEALAERAIERAQWLVEHEQPRFGRERAGERDPLLFSARELADAATLEAGEPDQREGVAGAGVDLGAREALHAQPERDVALHVAVGEQRVVLEHEPEAPAVRWDTAPDRRRPTRRARGRRAPARRPRGAASSCRCRSGRGCTRSRGRRPRGRRRRPR